MKFGPLQYSNPKGIYEEDPATEDMRAKMEKARKQGHAAGYDEGKSVMRQQVRSRWAAMGEGLLAHKVIG